MDSLAVAYDDAVVFLSSNGGRVGEAIEIGKIIRIKGYDTLVAYDEPWIRCVRPCLARRGRPEAPKAPEPTKAVDAASFFTGRRA